MVVDKVIPWGGAERAAHNYKNRIMRFPKFLNVRDIYQLLIRFLNYREICE